MGNNAASTAGRWLKAVTIGRNPVWTLVRIAVLVIVTFVAFRYVVLLRKIESTSMLPTLREGSIHLLNRLAYSGASTPRRGDIVGIRTSGETVMYIKRIIGLPGETIAFRDGTVLIDGQPLDEPYVLLPRRSWNQRPRRLEPDQYFIVGDNRSMSAEQHEFGAVERARIIGRLVW